MFLIDCFPKYCFDKRVLAYRPNGQISNTYLAVRPDTPPEIVERMKAINEEWKEYHEGRALYLFPGDEQYPTEWLNDPEAE